MKRVPVIFQHDGMQCGVACLAMVCRWYGRDYSLDFLGKFCFATTEGVSMMGISDAARRLGLEVVAGRVPVKALEHIDGPVILHWNQNHFVVLYKVKKNRFYIADPGKGYVDYTRDEFVEHWASTRTGGEDKGIAMFLEPGPQFGTVSDEGRSERRSWRFLLGYIKQYRRYFGQIVAGLALGCALQLVMPFLTQAIVDAGIKRQSIGLVWLILLGELMIVVGRSATSFIRRWLLMHISMRINISLVSDFFIKLLKLPMSFFDTKLMGDLMQRMGDHSRVQSFLTGQTLGVVFSLLSFVVFGVVLLLYDPLIFGVFILGTALYGGWIAMFLRRRKVLDYELFECQARNNNMTYQFITSMQEIKLQDCEKRRRWEWEDVQADLFAVQMKSLKLEQTRDAGSILINEVKDIVITVLAATAVINGSMTLGMMLAVQYIIGQLNSPVEQFMGFVHSLQDVKISLERINEIHEADNEEAVTPSGSPRDLAPGRERSIAIEQVDFKYDPHSPVKTIDGVTIDIPEGKMTAIVGASGSGKTTLLKLMLGYYPPAAGRITVGGTDLARCNLKEWRRRCGVVMQEGVIFSESIARNIAVDDADIDTSRLVEAARIACIHDYVMGLPLRYDTKIGRDGTGLSLGQRQRILIARAVYRNPDFILLDEATNSLDAANERAIVENLSRFYRGRTVVVVAHRLSTVRDADNIVVLDHGRVVEQGTHDSLIASRGKYYTLVKNQLELGS